MALLLPHPDCGLWRESATGQRHEAAPRRGCRMPSPSEPGMRGRVCAGLGSSLSFIRPSARTVQGLWYRGPVGDADTAIGTRKAAGARRVGEPLSRHLAGRAFNAVVRTLTVPGIQDTQCGFKMSRRRQPRRCFRVSRWMAGPSTSKSSPWHGCVARASARSRSSGFRADSRLRMFPDSLRMLREVLRIRLGARRGAYDKAPSRSR